MKEKYYILTNILIIICLIGIAVITLKVFDNRKLAKELANDLIAERKINEALDAEIRIIEKNFLKIKKIVIEQKMLIERIQNNENR